MHKIAAHNFHSHELQGHILYDVNRTRISNRVILRQYLINGNQSLCASYSRTMLTFQNLLQEMVILNGSHLLTLIDKTTTHSHLNLDLMTAQSFQVANVKIITIIVMNIEFQMVFHWMEQYSTTFTHLKLN